MGLWDKTINPLNAELNPICNLLALLGAHHIFHVSGLRVNHVVEDVKSVLSRFFQIIINLKFASPCIIIQFK